MAPLLPVWLPPPCRGAARRPDRVRSCCRMRWHGPSRCACGRCRCSRFRCRGSQYRNRRTARCPCAAPSVTGAAAAFVVECACAACRGAAALVAGSSLPNAHCPAAVPWSRCSRYPGKGPSSSQAIPAILAPDATRLMSTAIAIQNVHRPVGHAFCCTPRSRARRRGAFVVALLPQAHRRLRAHR